MCRIIESNPDIAGIGVRVSFYVQTLFFWLLAYKFPKHRNSVSSRTLQGLNCGLIISALIQSTSEQGLSLIDAIIVSMMSVILYGCIGTVFGRSSPDDQVKDEDQNEETAEVDLWFSVAGNLCTSAWGIFVWVHAKQCESSAVVVLFGRSSLISSSSLQRFALLYFTYIIVVTIAEVWFLSAAFKRQIEHYKSFLGVLQKIQNFIANISLKSQTSHPGTAGGEARTVDRVRAFIQEIVEGLTSFAKLVQTIWRNLHTSVSLLNLLIWCSILASIEQTIRRNNQQGPLSKWSFGQTLALTATLLSIFQSFSIWKEHWNSIVETSGTYNKFLVVVKPDWQAPRKAHHFCPERQVAGDHGGSNVGSRRDVEIVTVILYQPVLGCVRGQTTRSSRKTKRSRAPRSGSPKRECIRAKREGRRATTRANNIQNSTSGGGRMRLRYIAGKSARYLNGLLLVWTRM
ncbi:hypothetical protein BDV93DRAFT_514348 [Ceratobasidium sp. AG-I]|nr:hypothetical protein BDV93DRAFT_514348 [Ceratobasidium sp. AG-I]